MLINGTEFGARRILRLEKKWNGSTAEVGKSTHNSIYDEWDEIFG